MGEEASQEVSELLQVERLAIRRMAGWISGEWMTDLTPSELSESFSFLSSQE